MTPEQATAIQNFLLTGYANEHATTAKVLAAVPIGNNSFSPDAKSMTAIDLAWHLASSELFFMNGIIAGEFKPGDSARPAGLDTPQKIADFYREKVAETLPKLKALTGEQLTRTINFFNMFNYPAIVYIQFMNSHTIHHRGQLSTYLRPMGGKVPSIYGPSGDEPITATAAP